MESLTSNPDTIVHIGAGRGDELSVYLASDARRVALVEPNPVMAENLRQRIQGDLRVKVLEVAITDQESLNQLTEYNLPKVNSLYQPTGLYQLFPGLKAVNQYPVNIISISGLLKNFSLSGENNLLVIQAPGAEYSIVKGLIDCDALRYFNYIHLTASQDPQYKEAASAEQLLSLLQERGYDSQIIPNGNPDWPQWSLKINPAMQKAQSLKLENQLLAEQLMQAKGELDHIKSCLDRVENELKDRNNNLKNANNQLETTKAEIQTSQANIREKSERIKSLQQQLTQLQEERDKYKKQAQTRKSALDEANQSIQKAENHANRLQEQVKQLKERLGNEVSRQRELTELKQGIEYLFDQQRLQLEQATNALGRHVTTTAKTSTKELQAGIALQQEFGPGLPNLDTPGTKLPATVALELSHRLKAKPYDLIIEMGTGVTTPFMAQALLNRTTSGGKNSERNGHIQVAHYIDPSEDDLPKRIVCFEHNRRIYNELQDTLKHASLASLINLQFAPLVPYTHMGRSHLFYDCASRLQQIAKLFEDRQASIFILLNQSDGDSQPETAAALPQILQYLAAHTLDVIVSPKGEGRSQLLRHWYSLLDERGLEYTAATDFGNSQVQLLTINP